MCVCFFTPPCSFNFFSTYISRIIPIYLMDSSHNWLGFSLSNHPTYLLESFNTDQGRVERVEREAGAVDLGLLPAGPKLEDFLGGGSASLGHFSQSESESGGIYDSDLKTIAAGFLSGFSAGQSDVEKAIVPVESGCKKASDTFGQRTSIYRGVTRHRWTGRYEAHLWDNSSRREGQSRKGRQVYLGGYDKEEKAARAYDLAALKYWGPATTTNFPVSNYEKELEEMKNMTRQEFVASLRRKSSGFSRGASIYRGVTRHHQHGRWQARIGRVAGNKDLYLGTFSTQEEAAEAYDIAAIKFRGLNAVTNFDMSRYDIKSIANSNLPVGGITNKAKATESSSSSSSDSRMAESHRSDGRDFSSIKPDPHDYWSLLALQNASQATDAKNTNSTASHFQQPSPNVFGLHGLSTDLNMDFFSASQTVNPSNQFYNGGLGQQQNLAISYAAPISIASGYDSATSYSSWVAPSAHAYQVPKPNLSVFQTPIFGIE